MENYFLNINKEFHYTIKKNKYLNFKLTINEENKNSSLLDKFQYQNKLQLKENLEK